VPHTLGSPLATHSVLGHLTRCTASLPPACCANMPGSLHCHCLPLTSAHHCLPACPACHCHNRRAAHCYATAVQHPATVATLHARLLQRSRFTAYPYLILVLPSLATCCLAAAYSQPFCHVTYAARRSFALLRAQQLAAFNCMTLSYYATERRWCGAVRAQRAGKTRGSHSYKPRTLRAARHYRWRRPFLRL